MAPRASLSIVLNGIFRSFAARFFPNLGFQPVLPTQIVPVYFPAWIIDAEIEVQFSYRNHDTQRKSFVEIRHSYLPGSDFRVLSLVSLLSRPRNISEAVPFSDDLRHQHDTDVWCLPYTISPFAVLDIASSLSPMDAKVDDDLRFAPTSISPNLLAAYPVLIPLYLANYEYTIPGNPITRSATMFIEAHTPKGRIMSDRNGPLTDKEARQLLPAMLTEFVEQVDKMEVITLRGMPEFFIRMDGLITPDLRNLAPKVSLWLEKFLRTRGTANELASRSSIMALDDDPRVREYTHEERQVNISWIKLGAALASARRKAELLAISDPRMGAIAQTPYSGKVLEELLTGLDSKIKALEMQRAEALPSWWKNWRETSGDAHRSTPQR